MGICVCDISALELLRASGRLLPDVLGRPRTSRLTGCGLASLAELDDLLPRLGVTTRPYHLMVGSCDAPHAGEGIVRHVRSRGLSRRSLVQVRDGVLASGPEMVLCDLAESGSFGEVALALIGFELCGTYLLDPGTDSWTGLTSLDVAPTSREKVGRVLEARAPFRGARLARSALACVLDGSNSPMETVLAALLTMPRRLGGLGLRGAVMNYPVATPVGTRWVDVAFPARRVGLEYKGRRTHSLERVGRDDRRQNKLVGVGMTILNVWYEDLVERHLFDQLVGDLLRALGLRIRPAAGFRQRQDLLRAQVIPALRRYASGA